MVPACSLPLVSLPLPLDICTYVRFVSASMIRKPLYKCPTPTRVRRPDSVRSGLVCVCSAQYVSTYRYSMYFGAMDDPRVRDARVHNVCTLRTQVWGAPDVGTAAIALVTSVLVPDYVST